MGAQETIPLSVGTDSVLVYNNVIACLDKSEDVLALYKVIDGSKVLITGKEATKVLKEIGDGCLKFSSKAGGGFVKGGHVAKLAGKGMKLAKVGKFVEKNGGKIFLAITISYGAIKAIKGICDGDGKMVAKAVFGTAAGIGGAAYGALVGAEIGTLGFPVVGTVVGVVGGAAMGWACQTLVEDVIIENI